MIGPAGSAIHTTATVAPNAATDGTPLRPSVVSVVAVPIERVVQVVPAFRLVATLMVPATASVQVDWPRYGPKLAQVALAFGADDVYGAPAGEAAPDGPRRAPLLELRRHIEAAGFDAVERDGCFRTLISSGTVGA